MRDIIGIILLLLTLGVIHGQLISQNIVLDPFFSPTANGPNGYFSLNISCGPAGEYCNLKQSSFLTTTATQVGPWAAGQSPIGGERYTVLSVDQIDPGYTAGPADNIEISYDIIDKLGFATSPGIGATVVFLYNGPGNNVLPCTSTLTNPCSLDAACCTGANPAGNFAGTSIWARADGSIDLTGNGSQLGIALVQDSADHDTPLIIRVWRADGKSVVLTQAFESQFVMRTILFLYRDFTPFVGDSPQLAQTDVLSVLQNARAVAFSIYGAIALDARMTSLQTVGVQISKALDSQYIGQLFHPGDRVCWTAFVANNAPTTMNGIGTDATNVFMLQDVDFYDHVFWNSELTLDRSSITVTPSRSDLAYDLHSNDPTLNADFLDVTFPYLEPSDNVTIHFCGVVRNDFNSVNCTAQFCNFANMDIPIFGVESLPTQTTCIDIKFSPFLTLNNQCPTQGSTPSVFFGYSNTGNGPATDSTLSFTITGASSPAILNGLSQNSAWNCYVDTVNSALKCEMSLNTIAAGVSGVQQFVLNLEECGCDVSSLTIVSVLSETCSNLTVTSQCSVPLNRSVFFSINKQDSSAGAGLHPGQTITYTISFENTGNFLATGVVLKEQYPASYSTPSTGSVNNGWNCVSADQACYYNVGNLLAGAMQTIQFAIVLDESLSLSLDQVCNTISIYNTNSSSPSRCINTASATKCTAVSPGIPETGIKKIGYIGLLVYRITYYNNGTAPAPNAILRETIPIGTNFIAEESDSRWVCIGSSCTINLGTIPVGNRASVIFAVAPVEDFASGITACWLNRASISDTQAIPDQSPGDNLAALDLGNCNASTGPLKCPLPCAKCPDCSCCPPDCDCPTLTASCPPATCNCVPPPCHCQPSACNCPPLNDCNCEDKQCSCPNPCPTIEECETQSVQCQAPTSESSSEQY